MLRLVARRGYQTIRLDLAKAGKVVVYTAPRVADALRTITAEATVFQGVKLLQALEAVYLQGKKDGAREAFEETERALAGVKSDIPHRKPGQPRKRR